MDAAPSSPTDEPRAPARVPSSPTGRTELALGLAFWAVATTTAVLMGAGGQLLRFAWAPLLVLFGWPLLHRLRSGAAVADWIAFPFVVVTYAMLHRVVPLCWTGTIDPWLAAADEVLLGARVSELFAPVVSEPTTLLFALFYSSYYLLPVSLGLLWFVAARRRSERRVAFRELMVGEAGALFIGYLGYLFLPAIGPHAFQEFDAPLAGNFIREWIVSLNHAHDGRFPRDAFPSLHTANAVTILLVAWRHERRVLWVYGPLCSGLILATMYLRFHYLVDVLAGIALAVAWQAVVPRLVAREM